jgi:hypothetical protein
MKLPRIKRILLAFLAMWIADATLSSSLSAQAGTATSPAGKPALQLWQKREIAFFQTFKGYRSGDTEAAKEFDGILTEFETHPMARTPMENMDILGVFYLPKDGFAKSLPIIAMNAVLGWYDALRFGSESGRAEIVNNRHFFKRALMLAGDERSKEAIKFLQENPEQARALLEQGIGFAEKHKNALDYDHQWPTAFGLEDVINAQGGKTTITPMASENWEKAWEDAKQRVRGYYLMPVTSQQPSTNPPSPAPPVTSPPAATQ